jgi:hypothetical protein
VAKPILNEKGLNVRAFDPDRGAFDPRSLEPKRDTQNNPQGVRHPFKTHQDNLPVALRERHQRWLASSH